MDMAYGLPRPWGRALDHPLRPPQLLEFRCGPGWVWSRVQAVVVRILPGVRHVGRRQVQRGRSSDIQGACNSTVRRVA